MTPTQMAFLTIRQMHFEIPGGGSHITVSINELSDILAFMGMFHFFEFRCRNTCFLIKKPSPAFTSTTVWWEAYPGCVVAVGIFFFQLLVLWPLMAAEWAQQGLLYECVADHSLGT